MPILSEDALCRIFAETVKDVPDFKTWLLTKTKFRERADGAILLWKEQIAARSRVLPERWWRHWWCYVPELDFQRETDIFLVFETGSGEKARRFALHIENKPRGTFNPGQAAAYLPRARHMMNRTRYLSYKDFETVLLAPMSVRNKYQPDCARFDVCIPFEEIATFLPEYQS